MIRIIRLLPILSVLLTGAAVAGGELRTFDLKHRSAEEIIPLLRPMLPADAAVSGRGYLLIVRAPGHALNEAARLLETLDTRPKQLMITVRHGTESRADHRGLGVDTRRGIHAYGSEQERTGAGVQHLRTLEGRWARIEAGEAVPLHQRSTRATPGGVVVQESIQYGQFGTGFEVQPRISGNRVTLSVRPFRQDRAGRGIYQTEALATTVEGKLGEWIELGGAQENRRKSETGLIYHRAERHERENRIRLKVELVQ